jgi:hypothetical protein
MSPFTSDVMVILSSLVGMCSMYALGRRHGIAAERRRIQYLVDVAQCAVTSWSVTMLREAVDQRISVQEMREGLRKNWNWEKWK